MFRPIKLANIEINEPLVDIEDLDRYQAVYCLVKIHGEPLGQVWIPVAGNICSADKIRIAILEEFGWAITQKLIQNSLARSFLPSDPRSLVELGSPADLEEQPLITVAVCTRNRTVREVALPSVACNRKLSPKTPLPGGTTTRQGKVSAAYVCPVTTAVP